MVYRVFDESGDEVASDGVLDDTLRETADRYPNAIIVDSSTGKTVYESDEAERPPLTLEEARAKYAREHEGEADG